MILSLLLYLVWIESNPLTTEIMLMFLLPPILIYDDESLCMVLVVNSVGDV